jgi:hypothetical protein
MNENIFKIIQLFKEQQLRKQGKYSDQLLTIKGLNYIKLPTKHFVAFSTF